MNKIITISCYSLFFAGLFFVMVTQAGCQKQDTNCTCIITVQDTASNPVVGAFVKLYVPHAPNGASGTTNVAGKVDFTFALPAIFNVSVAKGIKANDTLKGSGIIQLQIGQTESTTVTISK